MTRVHHRFAWSTREIISWTSFDQEQRSQQQRTPRTHGKGTTCLQPSIIETAHRLELYSFCQLQWGLKGPHGTAPGNTIISHKLLQIKSRLLLSDVCCAWSFVNSIPLPWHLASAFCSRARSEPYAPRFEAECSTFYRERLCFAYFIRVGEHMRLRWLWT